MCYIFLDFLGSTVCISKERALSWISLNCPNSHDLEFSSEPGVASIADGFHVLLKSMIMSDPSGETVLGMVILRFSAITGHLYPPSPPILHFHFSSDTGGHFSKSSPFHVHLQDAGCLHHYLGSALEFPGVEEHLCGLPS